MRRLGGAGGFACPLLLAFTASAQTVNVWLTTDDQTTLMQPQQPVAFSSVLGASPAIVIADKETGQTIEGFGASMTDSAAYLLNEVVPPAALNGVLLSLFDHTNGIGLSFLRNPMGASDIARSVYSYDDQPAGATDPSLAGFSIAHDQVDIIPMLLAAKAINPQITMLGTPWSPPGWMKTTDSMIGGNLLTSAYTPFANYLVDYLKAYEAAGVPVDYLTLQNEPLNVPADYPGESMPDTDQLEIMENYVLPALTANGLSTRVLVYDHNWDQPSYPQTVLGDPAIASSSQVAGVAWHWYAGTPGAMTTLYNQYPNLGEYVTEASGGTWIADEVKTDFETIIQSMRNWAKSYVKWSLALDQNRGPHTGGCGDCSGLITVDETTGSVTNMIDYYTLGHFSKFILPGAVRVWSSNAPGIISAAFVNPDHMTRVLVVYNDSSSSETFQAVWNGAAFTYTLPALAAATFQWSAPPTATDCSIANQARTASDRSGCPLYTVPATAQIQASSYNNVSNLETESTADPGGGFDVGYASDGSWAQYRNLNFGPGVRTLTARVASGGSGGTLEFHLRNPFGPIIAQATVPVTGGWQNWTTVTAPVSTGAPVVQGLNSIYVVFRATAGPNGIANLNWFQFQ